MKFPFCKNCARCCIGNGTYLSEEELDTIKKTTEVNAVREWNLFRLIPVNGKCQFLKDDGCFLKYKPLSCEIYPFLPTKKGWVVRTICPFWHKLTSDDLEKVKREFEGRKSQWMDK